MGWITQEFSHRRGAEPGPVSDAVHQQAVANLWQELRDGLQGDIKEYNRWGGSAVFDASGQDNVAISDPGTGLMVRVEADLSDRHLRYEFQSLRAEVPAPDGGFLSLRNAGSGAELYSADQPLTCEQARRVLLQPVLFPSDTSTPLRQSA